MADQGVRVTTEGVEIAERHLELARVRFSAGSAARLDVLRAEVELANARAKQIRARSSAEVSRQALRSVLSLPQSEPLQRALDRRISYENGVITATELNDARLSLLETEWELMQAKYGQIVAAARTRYAAGL